jgi:hypothetical protein
VALLGGPSTAPLAVAMRGRWLGFGIALVLGVVGYKWWLDLTRGARALGHASAMVTVSDDHTACTVRRYGETPGSSVPCDQVGSYLRDKLNLSAGASVGITATGKVSPDAVTAISQELSAHGLKVAAVLRVGFISERVAPANNRRRGP